MITKQIINKIEEYNKIIIVRHRRPDGDCLGASLGLRAILRESFPEKEIVSIGKDTSDYLKFLGSEDEEKGEDYYKDALVIAVDTAVTKNISNDYFLSAKEIIKIDHHIATEDYGIINWVEEESSALCSMIVKLWYNNQDKLKMTKEAATCLFTGIITDSGRFRYVTTDNEAFLLTGELIKYNIDTEKVYANLYLKEKESILLNGALLKKAKFTENGVGYIYVNKALQRKYKLNQEQASNVVGLLDSIKGVLIWIAFIDAPDGTIRVRLRSRFTSVNEIAANHNGGGHEKASGATAYSKKEMKEIVLEADEALKKYKAENKGWM